MRSVIMGLFLLWCLPITPFTSLGSGTQSLPPNEWMDLMSRGYEVWDITCDPHLPGRLFATGMTYTFNSSHMFPILSTDFGTTWVPLTSSDPDWGYVFDPDDISLSVVFPNSTQRILYCIRSASENRSLIFRSTDLGGSWTKTGEMTNCVATAVQAHPTQDWLLASTTRQYPASVGETIQTRIIELIMKSTDGGATWTQKAYFDSTGMLSGITRFCFNPIQPAHVIALCSSYFGKRMLMSTNSGENWLPLGSDPDWQRETAIRGIAFHPADPDTFVAIHDEYWSDLHYSLKRTTDRGATWSNWGPEDCNAVGFFFLPDNPEVMFVVSDDQNTHSSAAMGIYKSTDNGLSWAVKRKYFEPQLNDKIRSVFSIPNGGTDLYCNVSGLLRSTDSGENWGAMYFVDGVSQRNSVWFDPINEQNMLVSQESIGTFRTVDGGSHWDVLIAGYEAGFDLDLYQSLLSPSTIYSKFSQFDTENQPHQKLRKSTDMGTTWSEIPLEEDWKVMRIIPSQNRSDRIFVQGSGDFPVYQKSDDQGLTWQRIEIPDGFRIRDFFDDPDISDRWYIIVDREYPDEIVQIWISDDAGLSWRVIGTEQGFTPNLSNPYGESFCMHPINHNLIAANTHGFFVSTDRGESWVQQAFNGECGGSVVPDPLDVDTLYAHWEVTSSMCRSANRGVAWSRSDFPSSLYPSRTDRNILYDTAQIRVMRIESKPPRVQVSGFWSTCLQSGTPGPLSIYALATEQDANDEVIGIELYSGDRYTRIRMTEEASPGSGLFFFSRPVKNAPSGVYPITLRAIDRFGMTGPPSESLTIPEHH